MCRMHAEVSLYAGQRSFSPPNLADLHHALLPTGAQLRPLLCLPSCHLTYGEQRERERERVRERERQREWAPDKCCNSQLVTCQENLLGILGDGNIRQVLVPSKDTCFLSKRQRNICSSMFELPWLTQTRGWRPSFVSYASLSPKRPIEANQALLRTH